jgi:cation diffusion facilitator family transporter
LGAPASSDSLQAAIRVSQLSFAWNLVAGAAGAVTGLVAGSLALAGFGLDALVDAAASAVLVHRFHAGRQNPDAADTLELRAGRVIGVVLILVGLFVGLSSVRALLTASHPERTDVGLLIAVTSIGVLPPLAIWKRRIAKRVDSRALRADSILTGIAAALAAGALFGLVLTRSFEWWWVDPAIALLMVPILFREGFGIVREGRRSEVRRSPNWESTVGFMLLAIVLMLLAAIVYGVIALF